MKDFKLSERAKDRVLNFALAGSVLLLLGGFLHQPSVRKGTPPAQNNYTSRQVRPLQFNQLPAYEPVTAINADQGNGILAKSNNEVAATPASASSKSNPDVVSGLTAPVPAVPTSRAQPLADVLTVFLGIGTL